MTHSANQRFIALADPGFAAARLFCFHHAGANAMAFAYWRERLPGIEILGAVLPGQGSRRHETPGADLQEVCRDLADDLELLTSLPYAFYGHSLGALTAFELAREVRRRGLPPPMRLFLSGHRAPQLPRRVPLLNALPAAELVQVLRAFGGTPDDILDSPEMMEAFLPILRSHLKLAEEYAYKEEPPLDVPIDACVGRHDTVVNPEETRAWRQQTSSEYVFHEFASGHFLSEGDALSLIARIHQQLG